MSNGIAWLNFVSFNNCQECATVVQRITQKARKFKVAMFYTSSRRVVSY